VLVVVCDYGNGGNLTLNVDTKTLGLKPDFTARDAETKEAIPVQNGRVSFPIKRHDFRMVLIE
jgi:hypothetical protein